MSKSHTGAFLPSYLEFYWHFNCISNRLHPTVNLHLKCMFSANAFSQWAGLSGVMSYKLMADKISCCDLYLVAINPHIYTDESFYQCCSNDSLMEKKSRCIILMRIFKEMCLIVMKMMEKNLNGSKNSLYFIYTFSLHFFPGVCGSEL